MQSRMALETKMRSSNDARGRFWQLVLGIGMLLAVLAILHTEQQTEVLLKIRFRYKWLFAMGLFAAVFIAQAWLWFRPAILTRLTGALERFSRRAGIARLL